ncbi:Murein L,D-transpeptidase YcbB/YkuD [Granulicella rosea]|uniref:Murein L,D-transpeptidase YcbB/YkuD n=1 Tax=Granulicella rosea TaxID=474952 RepID=A0A239D8L9_9BACT|nr:L,D-transpeptidase family protein [Granulicella rosea]SNS27923.1 Murein L,D-transpeptidase YcbB/YkuD [Granulicella rosea]
MTLRQTPLRNAVALFALSALLFTGGCKRKRKTKSVENTDAYADSLKPLVAAKTMQGLRWPNFADYEPLVQTFYDDRNYEVAWIRDGKPTPTALQFIAAFKDAEHKGLNPEDFDATLWDGRIAKLAGKQDADIAAYDAAMTVNVMRYISDLRIGRVNPTHFNFDINTQEKKYDLPEFVSDEAVDATDVPKLIAGVEPDSEQYRQTETALAHYLDLAKKQAAMPDLQQPLPTVTKPVSVGGAYPAAGALGKRLELEGDYTAPPMSQTAGAPMPPNSANVNMQVYDQALSDGVKSYQDRHSLTADGKLTPATIASLNVPLTDRVIQLQDSLERWRWLPNEYVNAPLMVNLPEFVLRGFGEGHKLDFTMKVVVGKVVGEHQTPVFTHMMKYLIFRPYWNVPMSIVHKELAGHLDKSGVGYLASHNFEVTNGKGEVQSGFTAKQVEQGQLMVREKPGPKNSLGLVKFMFPNEYDIYLHSTPQPELFSRSRRDFSHGCVRVQQPMDLAVWVLKGQSDKDGDWDMDRVKAAMESGPDNHQVNLKQPIPIVIFYLTANVGEDGKTHFFDDIYGYDKQLQEVLAKGMPYPATQQKVNPKTVFGDTN